jgi:hypothetical protein
LSEPRRLGEILDPTLARLETSDQARAYGSWARAAGVQIAAGAHPKAFSRGILTIECSSSVWASELTYLSDQILRRMRELAPDHPVKRLRFMVGKTEVERDRAPVPKIEDRDERPAPLDLDSARALAEGVRDDRLRAAIHAALLAAGADAPAPLEDGTL